MDAKKQLTKAIMEQARDYISLAEKEAWVAENAPKCFDKLSITADGKPVPPMYMVNTSLKSRYMMAALVGLYFGEKIEGTSDDKWLMSEKQYDEWAGSHIINQMERMKQDAALRFKTYDIMADYKDLEKRFSAQLSGLLAVQNDSIIRQSEMVDNQVKAELPKLLMQLKEMQEKDGNGEQ